MWDGHCIRILYVGWPLHIILCMGRRPYTYMHAYQDPLLRGGDCIRILYVGRPPLHKNSRCGEAIDYYSLYGQAICMYIYMHTYVYKESL